MPAGALEVSAGGNHDAGGSPAVRSASPGLRQHSKRVNLLTVKQVKSVYIFGLFWPLADLTGLAVHCQPCRPLGSSCPKYDLLVAAAGESHHIE